MHLKKLAACVLMAGLSVAGCAPAAATVPPGPAPTQEPRALAQPTLPETPVAGVAPADVTTPTAGPFELNFTPLPTQTALPTLELPTEPARAPDLQVWDGLPSYPAESNPDYYFRVQYDPDAWALTTDAFGSPALAHRAIANCIISPTSGRGLPPNATSDHDLRRIGGLSYQISATYINGVKQFVVYAAGDGRIYTAFQVMVDERPDQCLLEAEEVLATLKSVPAWEATPIATP